MAYYAGTSGRLSAVVVTPVLTTDAVDFSTAISTLASGLSTTAVVAEITKWEMDNPPEGDMPKSLTLESSADSEGVLFPDQLRGGVSGYSFSIQGQFNSTTAAYYRNGVFAAASFLLKKDVAIGWKACKGRFENYHVTGASADGSTVMFSVTFKGSGLLPAWG